MKKGVHSKVGMHFGASHQIFKNAGELRKKMTPAEQVMWEDLRQKKLGVKFRRQHAIDSFVLDFYCHELKLSIELDGGYHLGSEQQELDLIRTKTLGQIGISELRFKNEEVLTEILKVLKKIELKINELKDKNN